MSVKVQTFGDDMTWLGSAHGLRNARTVTVDTTAFSAQAKNGVIPSGTPVTVAKGVATPYAGSGKFSGFILTDQPVDAGKIGSPVLDHGRVNVGKLPVDFTVPAAADDETTIVFIPKEA